MTSPDLTKLAQYGACDVADVLSKLKSEYPQAGYIPDLEIYSPHDKTQVKLVGRAFTVQMVHGNDTQSPKPDKHFVEAASEGDVMVISAPATLKSAVWGGLMTAGAQARGVRGIIVDGRVRDLAEHRDAGFPIFARGHSIIGQGGFSRPSVLGGSVHIKAHTPTAASAEDPEFPGIMVATGDIVLADEDGVVVFKEADLHKVLEGCERNKAMDDKIMVDLKKGAPVQETMRKHRGQ